MSDDPQNPAPDEVPPDQAAAGDAAEPGDAEQAPDAPPTCAECGAELAEDQTYCLECGTPTGRAPKPPRGGRAGAMVAAALVVFGLGSGALAYAVINDDDGRGGASSTQVTDAGFPVVPTEEFTIPTDSGTGPLPPDTSGFPDDPFPTDTGELPPDTFPSTDDFDVTTEQPLDPDTDPVDDPVDDPDTGSGTSDWPVGESAWTVIVSSSTDESEARAMADRLSGEGEESGVLFSSDYPDLRPGYWVAFSGSFTTRADAAAHARTLSGSFPGSYPRHVEG